MGFYYLDASGSCFGAFKVANGLFLFLGERAIAYSAISDIEYRRLPPDRDGLRGVGVQIRLSDSEELAVRYDLDRELRSHWSAKESSLGFVLDYYILVPIDPGERLKGLLPGQCGICSELH